MPPKISFQSDYQSDTESLLSNDNDELNWARIYNSNHSSFITPSKKKSIIKKKQDNQQTQQQNWRILFTRTVCNYSEKIVTPQKKIEISRKYPKQIENTKFGTVTVKIKNQTSAKYENLCSICLDAHQKIKGILKCGHKFCFQCIFQWTKTSTNCPCCREKIDQIVKVSLNDKNIEQKRQIIKIQQKLMVFNELDYYICYVCNRGDDDDVLLICDLCDFYSCHVYCDPLLNNVFPTEDWFCRHCKQNLHDNSRQSLSRNDLLNHEPQRRQITQVVERTQTIRRQNPTQTQLISTQTNLQLLDFFQNDQISEAQSDHQFDFRLLNVQPYRNLNRRCTRSKARQLITNIQNSSINNMHNAVANRINRSQAINLRNLRRTRRRI